MAPVRQRVLNAAREIVVAGDWGRTRMSDVAACAGVSRQTLYNEFGGKDGLALALSAAQTEWFLGRIQAELDEHPDDPIAGIRAAVTFTLDAGADDPLLKAALSGARGSSELLPLLTTRAEPMLTASRRQLTAYLNDHWPELAHRDVLLVADSLIRLTVSHLVLPLVPSETVADQLAELAARALHLPAHPAQPALPDPSDLRSAEQELS
jgi:AcrR family transcriptional regulator